jgi:cytoskeleton protein RodZ
MAEEAGGEPRREVGCGIGARLRGARERAGLTIAQAAQRLHVSSEALEALEAERFEALGAPIYVKSYLHRYAVLLGEPPEALDAQLASSAVMPAPDLTRIPHATAEGGRYVAVILTTVGVLIVGGLSWWGWSSRHALLAVAAPVQRSVRQRPPASASHVPARVAAAAALPRTLAAAPPPRARAPAAAQSAVRITLHFPAVSWVSVKDASGHHLFRGTVSAGASRSFSGRAPLHVVLGYAVGVTLSVNDRAAARVPYVGRDHAASIAVTAQGQLRPAPRHAGG